MSLPAAIPSGRAWSSTPDFRGLVAVAALIFVVLSFDLSVRNITPGLRVLHAILATSVVAVYLRTRTNADQIDRTCVIALLGFAMSGVFSAFPRQSLDAVLGALLTVAALGLGRSLMAGESARRIFIAGMRFLSAFLTIVVAIQWIIPFLAWWSLTGWAVVPPLDLKVNVAPWGYRHDFALLLLMTYPAWWTGTKTRARAVGGIAVGVLVAVVLLIDGSRTVWFAAAVGCAAITARAMRSGLLRRWVIAVAVGMAIAVILVALLGFANAMLERVFRTPPLAQRGELWTTLIDIWTSRPITGLGPGSFPWALQPAGFFDTTTFVPRHADSALVQVLVEGGLVTALGLAVVAIAVTRAAFAGRSGATVFVIVTGLVASLTLNPTVLAAPVAVAIGWAAYGLPRRGAGVSPIAPIQVAHRASVVTAIAIGVVYLATIAAGIAYATAQSAITDSRDDAAQSALTLAARLDPGMALYQRELGTLELVRGNDRRAVDHLSKASALNPSDDRAWRILGLAYRELGDANASKIALEHAVALRRSDPANLLQLFLSVRESGDEEAAANVLAEVVQAWPTIIADPDWSAFISPETSAEVIKQAQQRWLDQEPSPVTAAAQPLLLGAILGLDASAVAPLATGISPSLLPGFTEVTRCGTNAANSLNSASDSDRRTDRYWALAIRLAEAQNKPSGDYRRLHELMTGDPIFLEPPVGPMDALRPIELPASGADIWGYGRPTIDWQPSKWTVPSTRRGLAMWYLQPVQAARAADLQDIASMCTDLGAVIDLGV